MMQTQCECDDIMSTSCQHEANHGDVMPTWCSYNMKMMTSCHVSPTWHEWNVNPNDVMLTQFALHANPNDVMLGTCDTCACAWQMFPKYF